MLYAFIRIILLFKNIESEISSFHASKHTRKGWCFFVSFNIMSRPYSNELPYEYMLALRTTWASVRIHAGASYYMSFRTNTCWRFVLHELPYEYMLALRTTWASVRIHAGASYYSSNTGWSKIFATGEKSPETSKNWYWKQYFLSNRLYRTFTCLNGRFLWWSKKLVDCKISFIPCGLKKIYWSMATAVVDTVK